MISDLLQIGKLYRVVSRNEYVLLTAICETHLQYYYIDDPYQHICRAHYDDFVEGCEVVS